MSADKGSTKTRIDKWLWAARFFKTRNLAIEAVNGGKVHLNSQRTKPAKEVHIGDMLTIRKGEIEWIVEVLALSVQRRSATEAALLYVETEESQKKRALGAEARKQMYAEQRPRGMGRPTKKDRRVIHRFKKDES